MPLVNAMMAIDSMGGIAKNGGMPWPKNSKDLTRFRKLTSGNTVLMGSKTWNDPMFPKPLPYRWTVVVSSTHQELCDFVIPGGDEYLDYAKILAEQNMSDLWLIGGKRIIEDNINDVDYFHLTVFDTDYECDIFLDTSLFLHWDVVSTEQEDDHTYYILKNPRRK